MWFQIGDKKMARLNDVRLYGCVAEKPRITKKDETGEYVRGLMHLAVVRSTRYSGETFGEKDRILFDWPLVLSRDPEMIQQMAHLRQYDVVEIKGMFLTKKIIKIAPCKVCGATNQIESNICYVRPMFMKRKNLEREVYTEKQAVQELIQNREISNNILILGNLCRDVNYYKDVSSKPVIETSVYQIATDRKYYVKEDSPDNRTDFPTVRSYGKTAYMDSLCLQTGSLILVDGFLHSRSFMRKSTCGVPECQNEFEWEDNTIEVIPYANEYLASYTDPEEALAEEEERKRLQGEALLKELLKN